MRNYYHIRIILACWLSLIFYLFGGGENQSMQIDENKKNIKELHDLCVVQIYNKYTKNHLFAIVYKIEHEKVFWYNPMSHTKEQITEEAFWELFTGCILVCDTHLSKLGRMKRRDII